MLLHLTQIGFANNDEEVVKSLSLRRNDNNAHIDDELSLAMLWLSDTSEANESSNAIDLFGVVGLTGAELVKRKWHWWQSMVDPVAIGVAGNDDDNEDFLASIEWRSVGAFDIRRLETDFKPSDIWQSLCKRPPFAMHLAHWRWWLLIKFDERCFVEDVPEDDDDVVVDDDDDWNREARSLDVRDPPNARRRLKLTCLLERELFAGSKLMRAPRL